MAEHEITLGGWAEKWFRTHAEGNMARNTEGGYRNLIFNHIIPRLGAYPILYGGLSSGPRQGELISLPWAAVDVCGQRVILKNRWVRLSPQAMELIMEEKHLHPDSPEAFQDPKIGQPYTLYRL